jgi:hypothetical protein
VIRPQNEDADDEDEDEDDDLEGVEEDNRDMFGRKIGA